MVPPAATPHQARSGGGDPVLQNVKWERPSFDGQRPQHVASNQAFAQKITPEVSDLDPDLSWATELGRLSSAIDESTTWQADFQPWAL